MTWTLVLVLYLISSGAHDLRPHTPLTGFVTKATCEAAGRAMVADFQDHDSNRGGPFGPTIAGSYACIGTEQIRR